MRWLFRRRPRADELDEEIRNHLALEIERRIDRGESPVEAERAARREFGNVAMVTEVTRSMWRFAWIDEIARDLKYALRGMRKAPGFTLAAVLILALGIGANTTIFSVINAALLRPLPFPDGDRLVSLYATKNGQIMGSPSPPDLADFAAASQSFESMVLFDHWRKNLSGIAGSDAPEEAVVGLVPGSYFEVLGIRPILGRFFSESENQYGRHFVAIIRESFWRTRFSADPRILGRTLRINGETYSVVGVIPDVIPGWMDRTSLPIQVWTPFASPDAPTEDARGDHGFTALARLKRGVSYEQAQAELDTIALRLSQEYVLDRGVGVRLESLADTRGGPIRPVLLMLWGAVGLVLAIACANLAGLVLARNSARSREMAVRLALGAGANRILRQIFVETLALALLGGVAGLGVSAAAGVALTRMSTRATLPYLTGSNVLGQFWSATPEPRILLFTLCLSVLTAAAFGLAPAFTGARRALSVSLREGGRTGTDGPSTQRFQDALVIGEIALSVVLVAAAAVMVSAILRLWRAEPGFRTDHLLLAHIYIPPSRYPDSPAITQFCERFIRRVRTLPGVQDASVTTGFPPVVGWRQMFTIPEFPAPRFEDVPTARFANVDEHYLRTMGIPFVAGRDLAESDTEGLPPVAVINEAFARRYFPNDHPVGWEILPGPPPGVLAPLLSSFGGSRRPIRIVGVVKDFMNNGAALPPDPQIVTLFRQQPAVNFGFKDLVVRTTIDAESIVPALSRELKSFDEDIPLGEVRTMEANMSVQTADTRLAATLLGLFAGLGMILAVVGVYGIIAYQVARRTREFGIRLALGARSADIVSLVLRHGLFIGLAGVSIGIACAFAVDRALQRYLASTGAPRSSLLAVFGTAIGVLVAIVLAGVAPARRAVRVDPVLTLRCE
jgi:predicted permease